MTAELASAALRVAMRGLHVFPLAPGTKIPVKGTHGCRSATRDLDVVRAWWAKGPSANIAIATGKASGLWVLDVDPRHGGEGVLAELESEHGTLPTTVEASTPSGGRHLYWKWPADGPDIRNSASRVGAGVDVLGEGGSAVAPPSMLADGRCYRWIRNGGRALAHAPAWLIALTQAPAPAPAPRPKPKPLNSDVDRYCAAAITAELRCIAAAGEGQRNEQLNRSAFAVAQFVAARVVPEDWARKELEDAALHIGLSRAEIRRTINSAFKVGMMNPRRLPE